MNLAAAQETVDLITKANHAGKAIAVKADVSKESEVQALVEAAEKQFGAAASQSLLRRAGRAARSPRGPRWSRRAPAVPL